MAEPAPAALIGVYRVENASLVSRLIDAPRASGWTVAWWALDEVAPDLEEVTVGVGPGDKLPLLNEILRHSDTRGRWIVVSDDDLVFTRGNVVGLTMTCELARLDLAQPARSDTEIDHAITARQRFSIARRTTFVEMGPLFAIGRDWRDRLLPFPDWRGMGWGLELDWLELLDEGCMLGVVDAVSVRHEGTRGGDYDWAVYLQRVLAELAERGVEGWPELQRTLETWRPWQRRPPWVSGTRRRAGRDG